MNFIHFKFALNNFPIKSKERKEKKTKDMFKSN